MEDKPYSVDSSDDINIEEDEEHIEDNHSKFLLSFLSGFIHLKIPNCLHESYHQSSFVFSIW